MEYEGWMLTVSESASHDRKPKIPQKRSRIYDPFQMGNETRQNPKSSLFDGTLTSTATCVKSEA